MFRLRLPDGSLSDILNLTRARDTLAAIRHVSGLLRWVYLGLVPAAQTSDDAGYRTEQLIGGL